MLLTDKEALEKANRIIKESGMNAKVEDYFWVRAEDEGDDIFCYYVLFEGEEIAYPPGLMFPLFKRNGEMSEFILPIPS